jgi:hypothetical protein
MPEIAASDRPEENRRRGPRITTGMLFAIDLGVTLALWGLLWLVVAGIVALWP